MILYAHADQNTIIFTNIYRIWISIPLKKNTQFSSWIWLINYCCFRFMDREAMFTNFIENTTVVNVYFSALCMHYYHNEAENEDNNQQYTRSYAVYVVLWPETENISCFIRTRVQKMMMMMILVWNAHRTIQCINWRYPFDFEWKSFVERRKIFHSMSFSKSKKRKNNI